jgi:hypothetical protein
MTWDQGLSIATMIVGPILGFIFGGWLTAKTQWGIEKQKMKVQRRRDLVDTWRRELIPLFEAPKVLGAGSRKYPFMRGTAYASLRPHLSAVFLKRLEGEALVIDMGKTGVIGNFPHKELIEEIDRIEREWGLI